MRLSDGAIVPGNARIDEAGKAERIRRFYAPFDAVVVAAFPTGHAVGLQHADGAEALIHIGLDTVKLGGKHFALKVESGQRVSAGDLLVEFDLDAIAAEGYDLTTPVIITNGELYPSIEAAASGPIAHGDALYTAVAKETVLAAK